MTSANPETLIPPHKVNDREKLAVLTLSMQSQGYVGQPILIVGDIALTGTHRLAAAVATGIEVQTLDVLDALPDLREMWEDYLDLSDGDAQAAAQNFREQLPSDFAAKYGAE